MLTRSQYRQSQEQAAKMLEKAGMAITPEERENIEVIDLGLGDFDRIGLALITYVNNECYCAKELIMLPRQSSPEHRHPPVGGLPGKKETFRCRWGRVWLYVEGEPVSAPSACIPEGSEAYYTVFHEIVLNPGDQYTIAPDTLHWFQAGDDGAIVSEFSSTSRDETDLFTDPRVERLPRVIEDQ